MADEKRHFTLLHQISSHLPGSTIHFTKQHLASPTEKGMGVSIERLLHIGAMREATPEEAKNSVEYGTGDAVASLQPFPAVPAEPTLVANSTGVQNIKDVAALSAADVPAVTETLDPKEVKKAQK